jgi:hypothetical protein
VGGKGETGNEGGWGGGEITAWAGMPSGCHAGDSIVWLGGAEPQKQIVSARYGV